MSCCCPNSSEKSGDVRYVPSVESMERGNIDDDKKAVAWMRNRTEEIKHGRNPDRFYSDTSTSKLMETIKAIEQDHADEVRSIDTPVQRPNTDEADLKPERVSPGTAFSRKRSTNSTAKDELDLLVRSLSEKNLSFDVSEDSSLAAPPVEKRSTSTLSPPTAAAISHTRSSPPALSPSSKDSPLVSQGKNMSADVSKPKRSPSERYADAKRAAQEELEREQKKVPDSLSDIPSNVDDATRERYLAACRLLRSTMIEKEKALLPTERDFLQDLLDDDNDISEAHTHALETASNTLVSDPLFRVDSVDSDAFPMAPELERQWEQVKEEKRVLKSQHSSRSLRNTKKSLLDGNDMASVASFQGREYPFYLLGISDFKPTVMTPRLLEALQGFFPFDAAKENFWLKFSLERDGSSLPSLLNRVRTSQYTIIGIETTKGEVFGAFCSSPWRPQASWFGSGESFLWRLKQNRLSGKDGTRNYEHDNEMEVYPFTGHDDQIQYCTKRTIAVGGGDYTSGRETSPYRNEPAGIGLLVDGDLMGGETNSCATFDNPRLCQRGTKNNEFDIHAFEVWSLTPCKTLLEAERLDLQKHFTG